MTDLCRVCAAPVEHCACDSLVNTCDGCGRLDAFCRCGFMPSCDWCGAEVPDVDGRGYCGRCAWGIDRAGTPPPEAER
jgi:hypothetical protein